MARIYSPHVQHSNHYARIPHTSKTFKLNNKKGLKLCDIKLSFQKGIYIVKVNAYWIRLIVLSRRRKILQKLLWENFIVLSFVWVKIWHTFLIKTPDKLEEWAQNDQRITEKTQVEHHHTFDSYQPTWVELFCHGYIKKVGM